MAITHGVNTRSALATTIISQIGAGGKMNIQTSGAVTLASLTLGTSAFTAAVSGTITLSGVPIETTAISAGTAGLFNVTTAGGTVIYQGTIATGGGDLTIDNTSITVGQTVRVTSHTYSAPV